MRGAARFRALSTAVVLLIAWVSLHGCLAEHQPGGQTFLQETFKAVILKPRPSSTTTASAAAAAAAAATTTTTTTALDRRASDTLSSKEREAEADALAADLVQSLSEVLLLLDRRLTRQQQQQQQHTGTDINAPPQGTDNDAPLQGTDIHSPPQGTGIHAPPQGTGIYSPPQGTTINRPPQGTDRHSPPQGTGFFEAEAVARRDSLWKELGFQVLDEEYALGDIASATTNAATGTAATTGTGGVLAGGEAAGTAAGEPAAGLGAGVPAGLTSGSIAASKVVGVEGGEEALLFEPDDAGAAAVAVVGVGEGDTSETPEVAAVTAAEGAGRQRLRGEGWQQGGAMMIMAGAETMAEGFPEEKLAALWSRGLAAEEPLPAFGGGGGGVGGSVVAAAACAEGGGGGGEDFLKIDSVWINIALTFVCVVCAGLAAGLTMGLLSIEPLEMAIKQRSGTAEEQRQAKKILPLVSQHHFLLVTLLLFNSLANEALPIFLGNLVPSWLAVILSVSLVLFFGEIVPSAVFTGKGRLAIAAGMSWFVSGLMFLLGPVAWPISWALDRVLGIEGLKRYNRAEIAALVEVQHELSTEDVANLPLHADEVSIVNGVLQTAVKSVTEAMITMDKVFCLSRNEKLSANTMADIMAAGYSRVLVYEGEDTRNIRGYLQVKKLIVLDPDDERDISTLMLRIPVVVSPTKSLLDLLNTFQTGRSHLALVSHSPAITLESLKHGVRLEGAARPVGIITLEDIIEEILQEEIMDESDRLLRFIEDRAKDTLLRFTRMRQQRHIMGRYAAVANNSPTKENSLLLQLSSAGSTPGAPGVGPPSPFFDRLDPELGGRGSGSINVDPPAAPGVGERAHLLSSTSRHLSGSNRRLLAAGKQSKRGGVSTTVAEAMIAAAHRTRESDDADAVGAGVSPGGAPGDLPRRISLFKQTSAGSVNNGGASSGRDDHDQDSGSEGI